MAKRTMVGQSRRLSVGLVGAGVALIGFLAGCASEQLVPLGPTDNGEAKQTEGGVQVRARVARHEDYMPKSLTPMKITVHNGSPDGVYVDLEDIVLVADGRALTPIPPSSIEPRQHIASVGLDPASPFTPTAPINTPAVPNTERGSAQGPGSLYEPSVEQPGAGLQMFRQRAKAEIAREAFSGGFIDSGQSRQGLVYFARPPKGSDHVDLQIKARSGEGSGPAVVVEIPYTVES
jgi:hypothetical protein